MQVVVWSSTGQKQTSGDAQWGLARVDLPAHTANVRFTAVRGRGYTGDMCVDAVQVILDPPL